MVPLNEVILYAPDSYPNRYFNEARNTTEWSVFIRELVLSGNALSRAMLQALVPEVPGAHIGIFDSHGLFQDIHDNPAAYLNGTAPLNVTGAAVSCVFTEGGGSSVCTTAQGTDRDSFLWWVPSTCGDFCLTVDAGTTSCIRASRRTESWHGRLPRLPEGRRINGRRGLYDS